MCPYSRIYPVRTAVVRGLGRALDDRKRAIRRLAAKVGQHNTSLHTLYTPITYDEHRKVLVLIFFILTNTILYFFVAFSYFL